ncbi:hypothetical protein LZC95_04280 [Pendulispora brunnea]|uniref:Uncharacterized protein n=1 Tax=Pendulispora brunnea TaxID=2905690 RepID=A0ABZ2KBQ2_9BACT
MTTATMNPPSGTAYPSGNAVGQGYQGEEYLPPIMSLGLCYRVTNDTAAQQNYGAAGSRLLEAMSTPAGSGGQQPSTDSGYGIRNYGVGMAFGYDWLYPALSSSTRQRVIDSLNTWIDWYDASGFSRDQPIGNYFAGYLLAKTATALATDGENSKASAYFDDVNSRLWGKLVKPAFQRSMAGGGWPEGWGYGPKAVRSVIEFLWAAKTARNLDWINEVPQARDQANYLSYFAWPSLKHMDDQGTVRAGTNIAPSASLASAIATVLGELGDAAASRARSFAADIIATNDDRSPWQKFLYWDPSAAKAPYQDANLSYLAKGPGHVAMRSAWKADAVWGALESGTYINAPDSGEQMFNQGNLSITVGDAPVLVNGTGWIPQVAGTNGEDFVYQDSWGKKSRTLYNTFFVADSNNPYNPGQAAMSPDQAQTRVERYEEGGLYTRARAADVEQMYKGGSIKNFTRDLVYLRPGTFVLFDRTSVASGSSDQWMAFHVPAAPAIVTTAGGKRFDVAVTGSAGSVHTLLPRNANVQSVSLPGGVVRLEEHSAAGADQQWLTVINAGGAAPEQVRLSAADGNVSGGNVVGVSVLSARNQVVLFPGDAADTSTTKNARYTVRQSADADHVLVDVAPGNYSVTASGSGGNLTVDVKQGGSLQASAQGQLCYSVSMSGEVKACPAAPAAVSITGKTTDPASTGGGNTDGSSSDCP